MRFARPDAHGEQIFLARRDTDVADHGAELLRQTGLVEHAAALAFQIGGVTQHRTDGGHACPANAWQQDVVRLSEARQGWLRQFSERLGLFGQLWLAQLAAVHRDEAGAETLDATEVLVARALIDLAFAPFRGFLRQYRQAARLDATITTAFAHGRVDDGALVEVDH